MNPEEKVEYLLGLRENGGTFWSRTHKTVRYLRVWRHAGADYPVIAVLTEIAGGTEVKSRVTLFVETPDGRRASEFPEAKETMEFVQSLLDASALEILPKDLLPSVHTFLFTPDRTVLTTW